MCTSSFDIETTFIYYYISYLANNYIKISVYFVSYDSVKHDKHFALLDNKYLNTPNTNLYIKNNVYKKF